MSKASYENIQKIADKLQEITDKYEVNWPEKMKATNIPSGGYTSNWFPTNNRGTNIFNLPMSTTPKKTIIYDDMDISNLSVEHRTILRRVFSKLEIAEKNFNDPRNKYMKIFLKREKDREFVYKLIRQIFRKKYVVGVSQIHLEFLFNTFGDDYAEFWQKHNSQIVDPNTNIENCDVSLHYYLTYDYHSKRKSMLEEQKHLEIIF